LGVVKKDTSHITRVAGCVFVKEWYECQLRLIEDCSPRTNPQCVLLSTTTCWKI